MPEKLNNATGEPPPLPDPVPLAEMWCEVERNGTLQWAWVPMTDYNWPDEIVELSEFAKRYPGLECRKEGDFGRWRVKWSIGPAPKKSTPVTASQQAAAWAAEAFANANAGLLDKAREVVKAAIKVPLPNLGESEGKRASLYVSTESARHAIDPLLMLLGQALCGYVSANSTPTSRHVFNASHCAQFCNDAAEATLAVYQNRQEKKGGN